MHIADLLIDLGGWRVVMTDLGSYPAPQVCLDRVECARKSHLKDSGR